MHARHLAVLFCSVLISSSACGTETQEPNAAGGGPTSRPAGAASRPSAAGATSRPAEAPGIEAKGFAAKIEAAHGGSVYGKPPIHADLEVEFGGGSMLAGKLVYDPNTGRSRIETASGGLATFDGQDAWTLDMATAEGMPPPRFHLFTWAWFLAAPWKLSDPGSRIDEPKPRQLQDRELSSARLTYDAGVGDTPDDWYVVYANEKNHALAAVAYIVTFGKSVEEANKEPHAAKYDEFQTVDGLQVPKVVSFWNWNEKDGLMGDAIGVLTFSNVRFATAEDHLFAKPEGAAKANMPR